MTDPKRTILITGAGNGLGRGLGLCRATAGHSILATDLDAESASQIRGAGGKAEGYALDVGNEVIG